MDAVGKSIIEGRTSVLSIAGASWWDTFRAARAMPVGFAAAYLFIVAFKLGATLPISAHLFGFVSGMVRIAFIAPLFILVHRYILLAEASRGYPLSISSAHFWRFVGFSILFHLVSGAPFVAYYEFPFGEYNGLIALLVFAIIAIVLLRTVILFPAIAINSSDASFWRSYKYSKGRTWKVFCTIFVTGLPIFVVGGVDAVLRSFSPTLRAIVVSAMDLFVLAAFAAAASHLYCEFKTHIAIKDSREDISKGASAAPLPCD